MIRGIRFGVLLLYLCAGILPATAAPPSLNLSSEAAAVHKRVAEFVSAWLDDRSAAETLKFFDERAYQEPPILGAYCDGWYKQGWPVEKVRKTVEDALFGALQGIPDGASPSDILTLDFPPPWARAALNDISSDHYLLMKVGENALPQAMLANQKGGAPYDELLLRKLKAEGTLYLSSFDLSHGPGDVFAALITWQHVRDNWYITGIDIVCQ